MVLLGEKEKVFLLSCCNFRCVGDTGVMGMRGYKRKRSLGVRLPCK